MQNSGCHGNQKEKLKKSSWNKLEAQELRYLVCSIVQWTSTKFVQILALGLKLTPPRGSHVLHRDIQGKLKKSSSHKLEDQKLRYLVCSIAQWTSTKFVQIMALGLKLAPPRGSHVLHRDIQGKLKKSSLHKLEAQELRYLVCSIAQWTSTKFVQIMALGLKLAPPRGSHVLHRDIQGKLKKSSSHKLEDQELRYLACSIAQWTSTKFVQIIALGLKLAPPQGSHVLHRNTQGKLKKSSSHKLEDQELRYLVCSIAQWTTTKFVKIMALGLKLAPPRGSHVLHRDI